MGIGMRRILASIAAVLVAATVLTACGGGDDAGDKPSITIYNAQHKEPLDEMVPGFTKETGIEVKFGNGSDFELANQLVQEGSASPADVFLTENSPAMSLVDSKGLFSSVDAATLAQVPEQYSSSDGNWAALVFLAVATELTATLLLAPIGTTTLATGFWSNSSSVAYGAAAPYALLMILISMPATYLLSRHQKGTVAL